MPLVGWSHSQAIASLVDAHLVTQIRNRDAIVRSGLDANHFTAIDSETVARFVWRLGKMVRGGAGKGWTTITALSAVSYRHFEYVVWKAFGPRLRRGEFDLVHRITPLSPTIPSLLATKCRKANVPFIVGPLNGGVPWPKGFDSARRREREWLSYVRAAHRLLPGYHSTRRDASAILIGSRSTWDQMCSRYHHKCVYIPENAIDPQRFREPIDRSVTLPLKVAFVGRLVPYKGADILLEAAAPLVREGKVVIDIIGDGPERQRLLSIARRQGIDQGVRFAGWIKHEKLQQRLKHLDVLGFPSIREFGGGVVLEAMAMGLVPIVVDYGGPGEIVTERTGFAVPMASRAEIIGRFRRALGTLVGDPSVIRPMGKLSRERVFHHFTWEAKARQVLEVYKWVLNCRKSKPDFGMPLPDLPSRANIRATASIAG